ncbi:unnamed protein product [Discula destructiva]
MAYRSDSAEPIAIVGSACRFAGDITSPSLLWDVASKLPDLSRTVPKDRFSGDGFFHKDAEHHGTTDAPVGYFLEEDHRRFDASFFNITPKEAEAIDPQQRKLMEVVHEAFESAGFTPQDYAGKQVGVFAGTMTGDYDILMGRDELNSSQYVATGVARSILSNRVSYVFDLRGPSMTIDTACSSSLVALHQAVQSLRSGESSMACVAGVNMMLTPEQFISESNLYMLSPTGRCRMWDAKADGYARGEGITALLIKPLSRALADSDHIQAIIRETGVNSDGKTQGITRPSSEAQSALIRSTYNKAGLDPRCAEHQPQFFEAHGTGTPVGDPLEARAISEAFFGIAPNTAAATAEAPIKSKMLVGSIKTVIGHTEGAAGLAGLLKVVQSLDKGAIIPNLHLESINPQVLPFCNKLDIVTDPTVWPEPAPGHPRRGSVNSFGFGGTNSHAIIEKYEPAIHDPAAHRFNDQLRPQILSTLGLPAAPAESNKMEIVLPLVISAATSESLQGNLVSYSKLMEQNNDEQSATLAWQLYKRQTTHTFRKMIIPDPKELAHTQHASMSTAQKSTDTSHMSRSEPEGMIRARQLDSGSAPKILGIFTGQGAQHAGMSKGLLRLSSVYKDTIKTLDKYLKDCPDPPSWTIEQELMKDKQASRIDTAEISQVTSCALQIGLVDFLRSLGINFTCVIGHSSGEIGATYAAGRITKRDAILISYYRGRFAYMAAGSENSAGGMAACAMSKSEAEEFCAQEQFRGKISLAANNAPNLVTLSGDIDALNAAIDLLKEQGVFVRQLDVDKAYHSFHMSRVVEEYSDALKRCDIQPLLARDGSHWVSSVSGRSMNVEDAFDIGHWGDNMLKPVLFHEAVETAMKDCGPFDCVIEVGPHPALKSPLKQIFKAANQEGLLYTGTLNRIQKDRLAVAHFLGFMWAHFGPSSVDVASFIRNSPHPEIEHSRFPVYSLPTYSWDHSQIYWRESRLSIQYHFRSHSPHELLGVRTRDDNKFAMRWRNVLKIEDLPWLVGHKFQGQALLPASAYCSMAFDAAKVVMQSHPEAPTVVELLDLELLSGITVEPDSLGVEILFNLSLPDMASSNGGVTDTITADFTLTSVPLKSHGVDGSTMTKNFQGKMRIEFLTESSPMPLRPMGPRAETMPVKIDDFYQTMDGIGLNYTGPFRGLKSLDRRLNYATATLDTPHPLDTTELSVSPALLDSCFQVTFATFSSPGDKALWTSFLPTNIDKIRLYKPARLATPDELTGTKSETSVEAYLTSFQPYSQASTATITADLSICNNSNNEIWIDVEGLKLTSFAPTKPEDDYELYLHTVLDTDPEDEIVTAATYVNTTFAEVVSSCERVARHYTYETQTLKAVDSSPQSPMESNVMEQDLAQSGLDVSRTGTTTDDMTQFMLKSRIFNTLEHVREMCKTNPQYLHMVLPLIVQEACYVLDFKNHLSRVVQQIAHRYPSMNILGLTDPGFSVTEAIMDGLGDSFRHYTIGQGVEKNLHHRLTNINMSKLSIAPLDLDTVDSTKGSLYDMVIVSTSIFKQMQKPGWNPVAAFTRIQSLLKSCAFIVLIDAPQPHDPRVIEAPSTPDDWVPWMEAAQFTSRSCYRDQQFHHGLSLHVRQAPIHSEHMVRDPLTSSTEVGALNVAEELLIIGGATAYGTNLAVKLKELLGSYYKSVSWVDTLEEVTNAQATACEAIIMLSDLESPVATNLNAVQLSVLKQIMRSDMVLLWVTRNATEEAERAAGLGLLRTLRAETPNLFLQVLDVMDMDISAYVIFDTFLRLASSARPSNRVHSPNILRSLEKEIHIEKGIRKIPRVVPHKLANARLNAYRRPVTRTLDVARNAVLLQGLPNGDGSSRDSSTPIRLLPIVKVPGKPINKLHICLDYSSSFAVKLGSYSFGLYVCVGRNLDSGIPAVALSNYQASIVRTWGAYVFNLAPAPGSPLAVDAKVIAATLSKLLFAMSLVTKTTKKNLVLINPDLTFLRYLKDVLRRRPDTARFKLLLWTTNLDLVDNKNEGMTYIHPWTSVRDLKQALPEDYDVRAFIPKADQLWKTLVSVCSEVDNGYGSPVTSDSSEDLLEPHCNDLDQETVEDLAWAIETGVEYISSSEADATPSLVEPASLVRKKPNVGMAPFSLLDWETSRQLTLPVKPHLNGKALSGDRTYLLVGLTRDFGQSLCRLFIEQGARHIIVASRTPNPDAAWIAELNRGGTRVSVATLDVTDEESVRELKDELERTRKPRLGGIVNGAMVLEDGVFANMTIESWARVMGPKVTGSKNLDIVFGEEKLEFFIFTSSFAAIGSHAGQAAYAAANMYMNGLARYRHARGQAGSVLNIGVIYGLGLLARDGRQSVYDALERDGYPRISERDLHHMFIEAIEAGRPGDAGRPPLTDLTTGLSRYFENDPNAQYWHSDPRFSHLIKYTVSDADAEVDDGAPKVTLKDRIASSDSVQGIAKILAEGVCARMEAILQRPSGSVRGHNGIAELGVDSLAAVEVRNWFYKSVEQNVAVMKILGSSSIEALCMDVAMQIMHARA